MFENTTRNQHFLPRVEQKLNALNPNAAAENLKIYSFRIADRDAYQLSLDSPTGRSIGANLSVFDLFSFDVADAGDHRSNFEALFGQYEVNIELRTRSLLQKLNSGVQDIKQEIIDLFAAKFLNFIRNPFSIVKVINTFPTIANFEPTAPALLSEYRRILSGKRPHQQHLCERLGITDQQYVEWLRILFLLLFRTEDDKPNLFEEMIKALLEKPSWQIKAVVCEYDNDRCLLSDRGYSQPLPGEHLSFSFNLCSTAFIHYVFADPLTLLRDQAHPDFLARTAANWQRNRRINIDVKHLKNHRALLAAYNRRVIEQCFEHVYCSTSDNIVLGD